MIVREVRLADFDRICDLTDKMMKESPFYNKLRFSRDMLKLFLQEALNDSTKYYLKAIDVDGQVVGGMFCHAAMPVFSCDKIAEDFSLFVDADYRGKVGKGVVQLINGYLEWCKQNDVKVAVLGILSGIHANTTSRMYEKLGIPFVGHFHARSL